MSKFPDWLKGTKCYRKTDDYKCYQTKEGKRKLIPNTRINFRGSAMPVSWRVERCEDFKHD